VHDAEWLPQCEQPHDAPAATGYSGFTVLITASHTVGHTFLIATGVELQPIVEQFAGQLRKRKLSLERGHGQYRA